jgi:4'-phosphopantetheinyl transferase EntD
VIQALLPNDVVAVDTVSDVVDAWLHVDEEAILSAKASPARRRDFTFGRSCARLAQERLNGAPGPVLQGAKREPVWPPNVVGSITHCTGFVAAAVGDASIYRSLGIDAEVAEPLPDDVVAQILTETERGRLVDLADSLAIADRVVFCAKEAVYKAWYPLVGRWLGFDDVDTTMDVGGGTFVVRLLAPPPPSVPQRFQGRFAIRGGLVLTAVAVSAEPNRLLGLA